MRILEAHRAKTPSHGRRTSASARLCARAGGMRRGGCVHVARVQPDVAYYMYHGCATATRSMVPPSQPRVPRVGTRGSLSRLSAGGWNQGVAPLRHGGGTWRAWGPRAAAAAAPKLRGGALPPRPPYAPSPPARTVFIPTGQITRAEGVRAAGQAARARSWV